MTYGLPIESPVTDTDPSSLPAGLPSDPSAFWATMSSNPFTSQTQSFNASNALFPSQNNLNSMQQQFMNNSGYSAPNLLSVISSASHGDLIASNNVAYVNLFQSYNTLFEQYRQLQMQTLSASSQLSSNSSALTLSAAPSLPPSAAPTELINDTTFPSIRFWTRDNFNKSQTNKKTTTMNGKAGAKGSVRAAKDINVMHLYVEHEDGTIATGREVKEMRNTQRSIFQQIKNSFPTELPSTWGAASIAIVKYHRDEMYSAHPCLRLCTSHWKVSLMATDAYSSWYKKNVKNKATVDQSSDEDDSDDDAGSTSPPPSSARSTSAPSVKVPSKRNRAFVPSTLRKKAKTASPDPSPGPQEESIPPSSTGSIVSSPASPTTPPIAPISTIDSSNSPINTASESSTLDSPPTPTRPASTLPLAPGGSLAPSESVPTPATDSSLDEPAYVAGGAKPDQPPNPPNPLALLSAAAANELNAQRIASSGSGAGLNEFEIVNPLETQFGAPSGPTQRSDAVSNNGVSGPSKQTKKRVNKKSLSAENLFYTDYTKNNPLVTAAEFNVIWANLPEEEIKKYKTLSAERNTAKKSAKSNAAGAASAILTW
ncbi:hypothetical protein R3P38DRAFT_2981473 [Favolaschia claudopus]|uniref:HMG box domain-containing protein n=1 Tax=Favolaschia claudopus TaxID=2862362 RepID=A0AAW0AZE7_9AGAR